MICPNCNQQPSSFITYLTKFDQRKIKCKQCGTALKGNKLIHVMFYASLAFGGALGLTVAVLEDLYGWGISTSALIFFTVVLVVGIPAEIVGWKYGRYELT